MHQQCNGNKESAGKGEQCACGHSGVTIWIWKIQQTKGCSPMAGDNTQVTNSMYALISPTC